MYDNSKDNSPLVVFLFFDFAMSWDSKLNSKGRKAVVRIKPETLRLTLVRGKRAALSGAFKIHKCIQSGSLL